ncbi:MAG: TVP38/TMEM64 family protein [Candidatus Hydrogenedentota bacterium]
MSDADVDSGADERAGMSGWVKLVIVLAVLAGLFGVSRVVDIPGLLTDGMARIEGLGMLGMAVFILFYILACILVLPGSVLTLGAGATYGLPIGFALVSIGSTLGATAAFVTGRYLARDAVAKKVDTNPTFKSIDDAVANQGWKIVLLTRLTPVIPFSIQNYGYGLTNVRLGAYVLASWIGMMPGTVLYTYIGTLGGDAAEGGMGTGEWIMNGVALVATIAVTVIISRIAKKALDSAVPTEEQP